MNKPKLEASGFPSAPTASRIPVARRSSNVRHVRRYVVSNCSIFNYIDAGEVGCARAFSIGETNGTIGKKTKKENRCQILFAPTPFVAAIHDARRMFIICQSLFAVANIENWALHIYCNCFLRLSQSKDIIKKPPVDFLLNIPFQS